jgi:hypothetical protein
VLEHGEAISERIEQSSRYKSKVPILARRTWIQDAQGDMHLFADLIEPNASYLVHLLCDLEEEATTEFVVQLSFVCPVLKSVNVKVSF